MNVKKIHWIGVGLSSPPGILYLVKQGYNLEVWNRSTEKASKLLKQKVIINKLDLDKLKLALNANDLIISMLPADMHLELAEIAMNHKCHFLNSSYYDSKYITLEKDFIENKKIFICEAGLDPGIDHILASKLVDDFKQNIKKDDLSSLSFTSMCGGFPLKPNKFKYKFSWTPLGVLKALRSPAKYIKNFDEIEVSFPFKKVKSIEFQDEKFEIYPNRNSIPYIEEYQMSEYINNIENFVRGTIRLDGWSKAWGDIFSKITNNEDLENLSKELWKLNQYDKNEKDRVLLYVNLSAKGLNDKMIYNKTLYIDESRNIIQSAMSQCVSLTLALTVECLFNTKEISGIKRIFQDKKNVSYILENLKKLGVTVKEI